MQKSLFLMQKKQPDFKLSIVYMYLDRLETFPVYFKVEVPSHSVAGGSKLTITVKQIGHDRAGCYYDLYANDNDITHGSVVGSSNSSGYVQHTYTYTMPYKDVIIKLVEGYGPI